jgi:thiamine biosynthesis lipoprotein
MRRKWRHATSGQRRIATRKAAPALAIVVGLLLTRAVACPAAEPVVLHGRTMGTTYNVRYWTDAANPPASPDSQRAIDALLERVDEQMSTWRVDSELSRFNVAPAGEWFAVSRDLAVVVERAVELHRITEGASDVTVGPVLRLWGFGSGSKRTGAAELAPPSAEQLADARRLVGAAHLEVRLDPPGLRKDLAGVEVDLSSIAPGYAIDLIVDELAAAGIANAMVELGGEVRGIGVRPDGKAWRIGVEGVPPHEKTIASVVSLANLALATSGDFHNTRMIDGVRYTHLIDPRTGRPAPFRGASVTVVAETCFAADGVPTAVFVMGADAGYTWCVEHDVAALFQEAGADGEPPTLRATPRFEELVGDE